MHFDDGTNPWLLSENTLKIFSWDGYGAAHKTEIRNLLLFAMGALYLLVLR